MRTAAAKLVLTMLVSIGVASGDELPEGPHPWKEAIYGSVFGPTKKLPVTQDMTPLLPRRKSWHVSLVVAGLDTRTATFCHGSMVGKGWVLTAASCVCAPGRKRPLMQVVVERETSVRAERRFEVKNIWLYQDDQANFPDACFDSALDGKAIPQTDGSIYVPTRTVADLALIELAIPDDVKEEPEILELMGGKDRETGGLLQSLAVNAEGKARKAFDLESVVTAVRTIRVSSKFSFEAPGQYLLKTTAVPLSPPCGKGSVELGVTVMIPVDGNVSICNPLRVDAEVSNFAGTALLLSDHKRPLGLGVYGRYDPDRSTFAYTSLQPNAPNSADSIACWIDKKARSDQPTPFFYEMIPLQPTPPRAPPGACRQ